MSDPTPATKPPRTAERLPSTWLERAREAQQNAYAPYSKFQVGSVLVADDGALYAGCNVENVSFGATICAERNALGAAILAGAQSFAAMVVVTNALHPVYPCGICRQMLAEFGTDLQVHVVYGDNQHQQTTLDELLPKAFEAGDI